MTRTEPADLATARGDRKEKIAARQRMKGRQQNTGYSISQRVRKRIEECFGWLKSIARFGAESPERWKLRQYMEFIAAAYNLVRMIKLQPT